MNGKQLFPEHFTTITIRAAIAEYLAALTSDSKREEQSRIANRWILSTYGDRLLSDLWDADFQREIGRTISTQSANELLENVSAYQLRKNRGKSGMPTSRFRKRR